MRCRNIACLNALSRRSLSLKNGVAESNKIQDVAKREGQLTVLEAMDLSGRGFGEETITALVDHQIVFQEQDKGRLVEQNKFTLKRRASSQLSYLAVQGRRRRIQPMNKEAASHCRQDHRVVGQDSKSDSRLLRAHPRRSDNSVVQHLPMYYPWIVPVHISKTQLRQYHGAVLLAPFHPSAFFPQR